MVRRLSRRAGPEHPVLFIDGDDIPTPAVPPRPRSAAALEVFRGVLEAAEATALADLDRRSTGRTVLVGGERRPPDALIAGDALIDDGTAVLPLVLAARAPSSLRAALSARFVLISGTLRDLDGVLAIEPAAIADLRALERDWRSRR